ncbi:MAG: dihydrofolate reductase, partial [Leptolyngbyaceae cyanobacterium SM1_3_5]|nr:dihydrofolate reductase [Leptolyngbyaceae cyanobacterium SM1_3_5]
GSRVARLAEAIGMQVEFVNSRSSAAEIDRLISTCDILSLHLPATAQSRHLVDERRLNLMKPTAYLINTARGAIVDQAALLKLLQQKRIAGAALDVFEDEPIAGTPNAEIQALVRLENVVATPHNAYNSEETAVNLGQELLAVIRACIAGAPINVVN